MPHMKAIQFTIDEALLKRLDANPEVQRHGRSEFIRRALEAQLERDREREIRDAYRRGYGAQPPVEDEFFVPPEALAWPDE
jgi:metal-responsive CopG/Arc/MetJ family transcriptional regulator